MVFPGATIYLFAVTAKMRLMEGDIEELEKGVGDFITTFTQEQNEMKAMVTSLEKQLAANMKLIQRLQLNADNSLPPKPKKKLTHTKSAYNVLSNATEMRRPTTASADAGSSKSSRPKLKHSPSSLDDNFLRKPPKSEKQRHHSFKRSS